MKKLLYSRLMAAMVVLLLCLSHQSKAQTLTDTLHQLYKYYDSVKYLTFDVKYDYVATDDSGHVENEQILGTFTMSGKRAWYKLGNIEFMQSDSMFFAVYHEDKIIMVAPRRYENSGAMLPLRGLLDSMSTSLNAYFTRGANVSAGDSLIMMRFFGNGSAPFSRFDLGYDPRTNLILSMAYNYQETEYERTEPGGSSLTPVAPIVWNKRLGISFGNYRFDNMSPELYSPNRYIWKDGDKWVPVDNYKDYRIYNTLPL